ncbi:hypothetical protein KQX54_006547 [Cotesia glomerata]|uniref:Uncharacterized protein n=1 Tax=Cotesia glomerata TaxID=32391 RepID=A0AAV7IJX6_COTGL|nr:hypothetical protein KQX54_006547 [Cotesia glomerata]
MSTLTLYDAFHFIVSNVVEPNTLTNENLFIWLRQFDILSQQSFCSLVYEKKNNIFFNEPISFSRNSVPDNLTIHTDCACRKFYDSLIWNKINTRFLTTVKLDRVSKCCDPTVISLINDSNPLFFRKGKVNSVSSIQPSEKNFQVKLELKQECNNASICLNQKSNNLNISLDSTFNLTPYELEQPWTLLDHKSVSKLSTCDQYYGLKNLTNQRMTEKHKHDSKKLTVHMVNFALSCTKIKPLKLNACANDRNSMIEPYEFFDIIELYTLYLCRYLLQRSYFEKLLPEYWQCMRRDYTKYVRQFSHEVIDLITGYYTLRKCLKCNVTNLTFPIRSILRASQTLTPSVMSEIKDSGYKVIVPNLKGLHIIANKNYDVVFIYDSAGKKINCCQSIVDHVKVILTKVAICCIELVILKRSGDKLSSCYDVWNTSKKSIILILTDVFMWNGENMLTISSATRATHLVPKFCQTIDMFEYFIPCPVFDNLNIFVNYFNAELQKNINFNQLYFDGVIVKFPCNKASDSVKKMKFSTAKYVLLSITNDNVIKEKVYIVEEIMSSRSNKCSYKLQDTSTKFVINMFQPRYQVYTILYDMVVDKNTGSLRVKLCLFDQHHYRHWCNISLPTNYSISALPSSLSYPYE